MNWNDCMIIYIDHNYQSYSYVILLALKSSTNFIKCYIDFYGSNPLGHVLVHIPMF